MMLHAFSEVFNGPMAVILGAIPGFAIGIVMGKWLASFG